MVVECKSPWTRPNEKDRSRNVEVLSIWRQRNVPHKMDGFYAKLFTRRSSACFGVPARRDKEKSQAIDQAALVLLAPAFSHPPPPRSSQTDGRRQQAFTVVRVQSH